MNLILTALVFTLCPLFIWQDGEKRENAFTVILEETACASTRRMRCNYHLVKIAAEKGEKEKRHFKLVFYLGADQEERNEDAISRLDRFFKVEREVSTTPEVANRSIHEITRKYTKIGSSMWARGQSGEAMRR